MAQTHSTECLLSNGNLTCTCMYILFHFTWGMSFRGNIVERLYLIVHPGSGSLRGPMDITGMTIYNN